MLNIALRALKRQKNISPLVCFGRDRHRLDVRGAFPHDRENERIIFRDSQIFSRRPFLKRSASAKNGFAGFESYISTEHFSFVWPILIIILIISFAGSSLSEKLKKGQWKFCSPCPSRASRYFSENISPALSLSPLSYFFSIGDHSSGRSVQY